jgi:mannose/cellobiose epimerase-like protein (N-acyl-D-glucosamine 2-epimerase family)
MTDHTSSIRQWLTEAALPLWAEAGRDFEAGGFTERLLFDGTPDRAAPKRVRVQARQIYVFAHAKLLGLKTDGDYVAAHGYKFLMRHACPDGVSGGFVHSLERNGRIRDEARDTYDHAFLLFAFSWYYRATGDAEVRATVLALGDAIWARLRHPGGRGFVVDTRGGDGLHQNPHMHLFEATLAAFDATNDECFLDRARELKALFCESMFDPELGVLREFYDARWRPAPGDAGRIVEPGHHCEWVWLLKQYADRVGEPLCQEAFRLHDFVERHGRRGGGILLYDEVSTDGLIRKASTRCWPQTEAIKADVALAEARGVPLGQRADTIVAALFDTFLDRPIKGAWIDWVDDYGVARVDGIPASTFYHVFLAFAEYMRARSAL